MSKRFVPIQFGLIEEGRLSLALDEAISETTAAILAHVEKYGADNVKGAKAEVILKIVIMADNPADGDFSLKGKIDTKRPGRPLCATKAIDEIDDNGEHTLFVRASGSDTDTPRQGILATKDGRPVDVSTGKVVPPAPEAKKG